MSSEERIFYIFFGATFSEVLTFARCSLLFGDFFERISALFKRIISQLGERKIMSKQIKKTLLQYPDVFRSYGNTFQEIDSLIYSHEN